MIPTYDFITALKFASHYLADAARALKPLRCKPDASRLTAIDGEATVHIMPMRV